MLRELHLRGLGVIRDVSVELSPGLNVVTGETGAGKTLLVTSLALLTGARAQARTVPESVDEAVVQGVVVPPPGLPDLGIDASEELILVRRVSADGRSRAWVGGQLTPVTTLAEIGSSLVEIHGQGAGFGLARPAAQLAAIDALGDTGDLLGAYRVALDEVRELERRRGELEAAASTRDREIELLTYQAEEIGRADLQEGEEDELLATLSRLEHAERLRATGAEVVELAGAEGAAGDLAEAHKRLQNALTIDPGLGELASRLADVAVEASEVARDIRTWADGLDADPRTLEELRERKALIAMLKRKYGGSLDEVIATGREASERLCVLGSLSDELSSVVERLTAAGSSLDRGAKKLTRARREACTRLTELVSAELPALALSGAVFEASIESIEPTSDGADRVTFLYSSSKSRTAEPIGKIASGGELSRAMIAVTLALAHTHAVPVLVFDEADQGVGGEAALEVGRRLAKLALSHQVLVVSHLPQIAAFADRHITVRRTGDEVTVEALDPDERVAEISRMLAGMSSSDLAKAHAIELLEMAAAERSNGSARRKKKARAS